MTAPTVQAVGAPASAIEAVMPLLGVRFREKGRTRAGGVDCLGLCLLGHQALGIASEDPMRAHAEAVLRGMREVPGWQRVPVKLGDLQPGDLLFVEVRGAAGHVDLYVGDGWVLRVRRGTPRHPGVSELEEFRRVAPRVTEAWRWVGR